MKISTSAWLAFGALFVAGVVLGRLLLTREAVATKDPAAAPRPWTQG